MENNVRYNISPCSVAEVQAFIAKIDRSAYIPRGEVKADSRSHYDRYSFLHGENKVAVVYDTTAHVISITGPLSCGDELLALFGPSGKQVKRSSVPAQGTVTTPPSAHQNAPSGDANNGTGSPDTASRTTTTGRNGVRSRVFVSPETMRHNGAPVGKGRGDTVMVTAKGAEVSTDEIFPPQRSFKTPRQQEPATKRVYSYGSGYIDVPRQDPPVAPSKPKTATSKPQQKDDGYIAVANARTGAAKRRATISFGDEDDDVSEKKYQSRSGGTGVFADISGERHASEQFEQDDAVKRKRGRPPKAATGVQAKPGYAQKTATENAQPEQTAPEYKNGYSVKNYPQEALDGLLKRLRSFSKYKVSTEGTEFFGTPQEVRIYSVTDTTGVKVYLRYATNKRTLQLQGKRSELFGEIQSQVSRDSDYSSALEDYVEKSGNGNAGKNKVSDVQKRLKKRLPTAFDFLSEQSRIDFSYGLHDFDQGKLELSDYSVLLVPPYRGLERFVFDLQRAEGIKVKMIGQAFDKDDSGKYILKNGYTQRIGSVIYGEVLVALYTEYFSRRNFFAHSDNTDENLSRSITDRAKAKKIFDDLLDTVEYNAKKLREIGFSMESKA